MRGVLILFLRLFRVMVFSLGVISSSRFFEL